MNLITMHVETVDTEQQFDWIANRWRLCWLLARGGYR